MFSKEENMFFKGKNKLSRWETVSSARRGK
jgi:hypothetical protein